MTDLLITAVYTGAPDEIFEFHTDGQARTFGRDDRSCDIVIWSAINSRRLSRVAGRLWRADGEMWIRNLSHMHDLELVVPGHPPEPPLPPRGRDQPGVARSLPAGTCVVLGPDGCELVIRQERPSADDVDPDTDETGGTLGSPPLPPELRLIALALCEPLLHGSRLPATYSEVVRRVGGTTLRRVRDGVAELCRQYENDVPSLRRTAAARRARQEADLEAGPTEQIRGGVRRFAPREPEEMPATSTGFAMPAYYDVALLLIRRGVLTVSNLSELDDQS